MLLAVLMVLGPGSVRAEGTGDGSPELSDAPSVVRLLPSAVVTTDEVRLQDVAELEGESPRLAADWVVSPAPLPGTERLITLDQVEEVLNRGGANLARWTLRGSSQCTVTRPADNPAQLTTQSPAGAVARDKKSTGSQPPANTLEAVLREHIASRLAHLPGRPEIRFNPSVTRLLALSRPTYDFKINDRSERLVGLVSFEVVILEKQLIKQTQPVVAEVALVRSVVVARRGVNRGETITAADLTLQERTFDRLDQTGIGEIDSLVGQRARTLIRQGAMIQPQDIESVPLVQRNDLVTVWVRRGGLVIKGTAKAMGSGGYGEMVELKNEVSKQSFSAVVIGSKTVELAVSASGRPTATAPAEQIQ